MPLSTLTMDITVLPANVLSLCDEPFYELVSKLAGAVEAKLLKVQGVRNAYSLMHIDDIFDVLKYECKALDEIKTDACLLLDDHRYIVKPGCKSNLRYFTQLLKLKNQEHLKTIALQMKSKQKSNDNDNSNTSTSQSSAQVLPVSPPISQDTTITTNQMNESKHRNFLTTSLDEWVYKNNLILNLSNEKLIEGTDYKLTLLFNQASEEAFITCACGVRINLPKEKIHFSLSNYYKHIKTLRCTMMKNKRKLISNNTNHEDNESPQQQILETDVVDNSTTPKSNIDNNNKQSRYSSKKRTKSASYSDSLKKIRQR